MPFIFLFLLKSTFFPSSSLFFLILLSIFHPPFFCWNRTFFPHPFFAPPFITYPLFFSWNRSFFTRPPFLSHPLFFFSWNQPFFLPSSPFFFFKSSFCLSLILLFFSSTYISLSTPIPVFFSWNRPFFHILFTPILGEAKPNPQNFSLFWTKLYFCGDR